MIDLSERVKGIHHDSEKQFALTFFDHDKWVHEPRFFYLPDGTKYKPDFYDAQRDVYIEVVGSHAAFHHNKAKYSLFNDTFPGTSLEFRTRDGNLLFPNFTPTIPRKQPLPAPASAQMTTGTKPTFEEAAGWLLKTCGSLCQVAKWLKMSKSNAQRIFDMNEYGSGVERTREWVCFKVQEYFLSTGDAT